MNNVTDNFVVALFNEALDILGRAFVAEDVDRIMDEMPDTFRLSEVMEKVLGPVPEADVLEQIEHEKHWPDSRIITGRDRKRESFTPFVRERLREEAEKEILKIHEQGEDLVCTKLILRPTREPRIRMISVPVK